MVHTVGHKRHAHVIVFTIIVAAVWRVFNVVLSPDLLHSSTIHTNILNMIRCGGPSPTKDADELVQEICDQVRSAFEEKAGRNFAEYTAHSVCTQVVAGTNYFVKLHVGNEEYVHVRIYKPLPGQGGPEVHSFQDKKTKEDVLDFFG